METKRNRRKVHDMKMNFEIFARREEVEEDEKQRAHEGNEDGEGRGEEDEDTQRTVNDGGKDGF